MRYAGEKFPAFWAANRQPRDKNNAMPHGNNPVNGRKEFS